MENKLIISNDYSYFISDDVEIKSILNGCLKFREKNYYHNRRYKMKLWDGYTEFFQKDTGKFLTGLIPEIKAVLKAKNISYTVEENRNKIKFLYDSVDKDFGNTWKEEKNIERNSNYCKTLLSCCTMLASVVLKG